MIQDSLKAHYEYVCQHYHKQQILGVFLYGSQNYNRGAKCSKKGRSVSILERF